MVIASDDSLYRQNADREWVCVLCGQVCKHGIARENHARKYEREACGCLVIASDMAPVREVIRHGENGLLVDFFDIDAMARSVVEVLRRKASFFSLRLNAAKREHYGLERGVAGYKRLPQARPHGARRRTLGEACQ